MTGKVTMTRLLVVAMLLSPSLAFAQPADDPGLSEPPKPAPPFKRVPPPSTVPRSDAAATVMPPRDEALTTEAPRETVDTQVTWLDEAGPQTAVRMTGEDFYSVHNDTEAEAQLLIFSSRLDAPPVERAEGFWP